MEIPERIDIKLKSSIPDDQLARADQPVVLLPDEGPAPDVAHLTYHTCINMYHCISTLSTHHLAVEGDWVAELDLVSSPHRHEVGLLAGARLVVHNTGEMRERTVH